jgi:hypothetical protein
MRAISSNYGDISAGIKNLITKAVNFQMTRESDFRLYALGG